MKGKKRQQKTKLEYQITFLLLLLFFLENVERERETEKKKIIRKTNSDRHRKQSIKYIL